jgi:DNA-directed RNA polymerase alpha subunit
MDLIVHIGRHEIPLDNCCCDNPDLRDLLKHAKTIVVVVEQGSEAASALSRVICSRPRTKTTDEENKLIECLSQRLSILGLTDRTVRWLKTADYIYLWQVVEKTKKEMMATWQYGGRSNSEMLEVFTKATLQLGREVNYGMDLSSILDHLPRAPHKG